MTSLDRYLSSFIFQQLSFEMNHFKDKKPEKEFSELKLHQFQKLPSEWKLMQTDAVLQSLRKSFTSLARGYGE